ncbi:MAG: ORF6N domain-containing protein [Bacteroidetes bacterium]|nr:ORF6N domain-containing protein [Bacteroidota bacterium]
MKNELVKENFESLIYEFRGVKIMLDYDLALLYDIETRALKQAVRRNIKRFPKDFMFELSHEEHNSLRSQIVILKRGQHSKYPPFAFTEHGVSMLSSVLNSDRAIQINIEIMRAFSKYRALLLESKELNSEIKRLDSKIDKVLKYLLSKIDALQQKKLDVPCKKIGYKSHEK